MPKFPFSREDHIELDILAAKTTLKERKSEVDEARLDEGVRKDWETLKDAKNSLRPEELRAVMKTIVRMIHANKMAALQVIPPKTYADIQAELKSGVKPEDISIDPFELLMKTNLHVSSEIGVIEPKALHALAVTKKTIAEQLRLLVEAKKANQDAAKAVEQNQTLALDAETLKIDRELNELIDYISGGEALEEGIREIMGYLKKIAGEKFFDIAFYLVNEENHYEETAHLTKINLSGKRESSNQEEFTKKNERALFDEDEKKFLFFDPTSNTVFVELKIADRKLGVLEITMAPGQTLDQKLQAFVDQARTRLDSKIDEALKARRITRLDKLAHGILDRHGASSNFEKGLAELMKEICLYSKATEADLLLVVSDEDEGECDHFIAKRYSDDHDPENLADTPELRGFAEQSAKTLNRSGGKHTLIKDIIDPSRNEQGQKKIIGKIIFRTDESEELTDEDKTFLRMASMILASHASQWRNNLRLMVEGRDPKIAAAEMGNGIEEIVRSETSTIITDISGYTRICNLIERKLFKNDKASIEALSVIKNIVQDFLVLCQRIGTTYCGTWDKAVGDMAIMHFGVPIDTTGRDPLGYKSDERHPEFFAMNALKAALLIQKELNGLSEKFRVELIKIAEKKFVPPSIEDSEQTDEWMEYQENPEEWYLTRLREEFGLSPVIDTTTAVYSGDSGYVKLDLLSSNDYTLVGTTMNTSARTQGKARRKQILIPRRTHELVKTTIASDTAVPYRISTKKGSSRQFETFSEFLKNKLGLAAEHITVAMNEQYAAALKNLDGSNLSYSVELRNGAAALPSKGDKLDAEKLAQFEGQEFSISHAQISEGKVKYTLGTVPVNGEKGVSFKAEIGQGDVEEVVPIYVARTTYEKRRRHGSHRVLRVQDKRFTEFVYIPLGDLQKKELRQVLDQDHGDVQGNVLNHKNTPSGCYRILTTTQKGETSTLELSKGSYLFKVNIRDSRITRGLDNILPDDEVLCDFKAYLAEIIDEVDWDLGEQNIIFVHKGDYYLVNTGETKTIMEELKTQIHRSVPPHDDRSHRYTIAPGYPRSTAVPSMSSIKPTLVPPPESSNKNKA